MQSGATRFYWTFASFQQTIIIIHKVNCFEPKKEEACWNSFYFFIGFSKSGLLRCPTRRESVPLGSTQIRNRNKEIVVGYYLLEGNSLFLKRLIFGVLWKLLTRFLAGINYMFWEGIYYFAIYRYFSLFFAIFNVFVNSHALTCATRVLIYKFQDASSLPVVLYLASEL